MFDLHLVSIKASAECFFIKAPGPKNEGFFKVSSYSKIPQDTLGPLDFFLSLFKNKKHSTSSVDFTVIVKLLVQKMLQMYFTNHFSLI